MNTFRVISTTNCVKCTATKRMFTKQGVPFEDLAEEDVPDIVEEAKASGATSFPIVIAPDGSWWFDFRKDLVDSWAKSQHVWRKDVA